MSFGDNSIEGKKFSTLFNAAMTDFNELPQAFLKISSSRISVGGMMQK